MLFFYLNKRQQQILEYLILNKDRLTIEKISKKFLVTERTIRNDLELIGDFLASRNIVLSRDKAGAFYTENADADQLAELISSDTVLILDQEERQQLIILSLLGKKEPLTIEDISNFLGVSYSTVANDLKNIHSLLSELSLTMVKRPNYGIALTGDEKAIRASIIKIITSNVEPRLLNGLINRLDSSLHDKVIESFFDLDFLREIRGFYYELCLNFRCGFSDSDSILLVLGLAIKLKRINIGKSLDGGSIAVNAESAVNEDLYAKMAEFISQRAENSYSIKMNEHEMNDFIMLFKSTRFIFFDEITISECQQSLVGSMKKAELATWEVIKRIEALYGIDLMNNSQLVTSLVNHLALSFYRVENHLLVYNPLTDEIRQNYPYLFNLVSFMIEDLIKTYEFKKMPDEEISYIVIYLQMAFENMKINRSIKPKAVVICNTSNIISKYLRVKLEKEFPELDLIGPVPLEMSGPYVTDNSRSDLIISTEPLKSVSSPVCIISPIVTKNDIDKIYSALTDLAKSNSVGYKGGEQYMLEDVLNRDAIKLKVEAKSWEEAIRRSGELLLKLGFIENQYIDAMIQTVNKLGPYIVIAPGIALAHARPEEGAIKTGFSLITLEEPVNFGNTENDPVNLIIAIAAIDHDSHIKAISELIDVIGNKDKYEKITSSNDLDEVFELIYGTLVKK